MLLVGFALAAVGVALPAATATGLVIGSAPAAQAGAATGVSETSGEFGIALGWPSWAASAPRSAAGQLAVPAGLHVAALVGAVVFAAAAVAARCRR